MELVYFVSNTKLSDDQLKQIIKDKHIIPQGALLNGSTPMDAENYYIQTGDMRPMEELREIVDNPIFDANELTLETVYMRAYKADEAGDVDGWRMAFSVKYGDVIVEVRTKGVEPEWVYQQLMNLLEN